MGTDTYITTRANPIHHKILAIQKTTHGKKLHRKSVKIEQIA